MELRLGVERERRRELPLSGRARIGGVFWRRQLPWNGRRRRRRWRRCMSCEPTFLPATDVLVFMRNGFWAALILLWAYMAVTAHMRRLILPLCQTVFYSLFVSLSSLLFLYSLSLSLSLSVLYSLFLSF